MKTSPSYLLLAALAWSAAATPTFGATPATATPATPPAPTVQWVYPSNLISTFTTAHLDKLLAPLSSDFTPATAFNADLVKVPADVRAEIAKFKDQFSEKIVSAPPAGQVVLQDALAVCAKLNAIMDERDKELVALVATRPQHTQVNVIVETEATGARGRRGGRGGVASVEAQGAAPADIAQSDQETTWLKEVPDFRNSVDYLMDQLRRAEQKYKTTFPDALAAIASPPAPLAPANPDSSPNLTPATAKGLALKTLATTADVRKIKNQFLDNHPPYVADLKALDTAANSIINEKGDATAAEIKTLNDTITETIRYLRTCVKEAPNGVARNNANRELTQMLSLRDPIK